MRNILIATTLFFLVCIKAPNEITTVSETDSGQILGVVVYKNGHGVKGADVVLRHEDMLKKIVVGLGKIVSSNEEIAFSGKRFDSTITTPAGVFAFDSVDTGKFLIEINDHDSLGALVEAEITIEEPVYNVDSIVLNKFGAIRGNVNTELLSSTDENNIFIAELDRKIPINEDGSFNADNLPEYNYTIHILVGDSVIASVLDTAKIEIKEEETRVFSDIGIETGSIEIDGTIEER